MPVTSAGICVWRRTVDSFEVLIVHPGGPYWARKDDGAWSLPKGEYDPEVEDGPTAARREFFEELGQRVPDGELVALGQTKLKSGKLIDAWAIEGDLDADSITSNLFEIEWPPRSGRRQEFPEVDRARWCSPAVAAVKLNAAQVVFVERLAARVS